MERIAQSARLEAQIEELLGDELAANGEKLSQLGRLGARLVLQRAVEDEVTAFVVKLRLKPSSRRFDRSSATVRPPASPRRVGDLTAFYTGRWLPAAPSKLRSPKARRPPKVATELLPEFHSADITIIHPTQQT